MYFNLKINHLREIFVFYINLKSNIKDNPSKRIYNVIVDGKYTPRLTGTRSFLAPQLKLFFCLNDGKKYGIIINLFYLEFKNGKAYNNILDIKEEYLFICLVVEGK